MGIETSLHGAIVKGFEELDKLEVGTEAHKIAVDELTKLLDRAIEMDKIDLEHNMNVENQEFEKDLKQKQFEAERKDRWWRNSISIGQLVVPAGLAIWGTFKTFKFEEKGTITTHMGRGFINMLLPKK